MLNHLPVFGKNFLISSLKISFILFFQIMIFREEDKRGFTGLILSALTGQDSSTRPYGLAQNDMGGRVEESNFRLSNVSNHLPFDMNLHKFLFPLHYLVT